MRGLLYVLEIVFFEVREADKGAASARAMAAYIQHGNLAQVVPLLPRQNACNKWQGYWRAGFIHVFKKVLQKSLYRDSTVSRIQSLPLWQFYEHGKNRNGKY